jgi:hypothetical protein
LAAYANLGRSLAGRQSIGILKSFRNEGLAHIRTDALFDTTPRYGDLFRLVDVAKIVVGRAMLAVLGKNDAFSEVEEHAIEQATAFWEPALVAAHQASRWDRPLED